MAHPSQHIKVQPSIMVNHHSPSVYFYLFDISKRNLQRTSKQETFQTYYSPYVFKFTTLSDSNFKKKKMHNLNRYNDMNKLALNIIKTNKILTCDPTAMIVENSTVHQKANLHGIEQDVALSKRSHDSNIFLAT